MHRLDTIQSKHTTNPNALLRSWRMSFSPFQGPAAVAAVDEKQNCQRSAGRLFDTSCYVLFGKLDLVLGRRSGALSGSRKGRRHQARNQGAPATRRPPSMPSPPGPSSSRD